MPGALKFYSWSERRVISNRSPCPTRIDLLRRHLADRRHQLRHGHLRRTCLPGRGWSKAGRVCLMQQGAKAAAGCVQHRFRLGGCSCCDASNSSTLLLGCTSNLVSIRRHRRCLLRHCQRWRCDVSPPLLQATVLPRRRAGASGWFEIVVSAAFLRGGNLIQRACATRYSEAQVDSSLPPQLNPESTRPSNSP